MDERAEKLIVHENQRLRSEVKWLSRRLTEIETSRWWRMHPTLLRNRVRRLRSLTQERRRAALTPSASIAGAPYRPSRLAEGFRKEVIERGSFSQEWSMRHLDEWETILRELADRPARVLEIGSFEGLSACYFLWRLPHARLTCVDTFAGSSEHVDSDLDFSQLESVFERNVALVDASRVRKLVGDSRRMLVDLEAEGGKFDLIYIDGSHFALDVVVDAALSWQLVEVDGVVLFDDYEWARPGTDGLEHPRRAIDAFLSLVDAECELLFKGYQVALRKTSG